MEDRHVSGTILYFSGAILYFRGNSPLFLRFRLHLCELSVLHLALQVRRGLHQKTDKNQPENRPKSAQHTLNNDGFVAQKQTKISPKYTTK